MRSLCLWTNVIDEVDLYQGTHYNVSGNWKMENSKIFQRQERKQMVYTSSEIQTILRCLNMSPGEGNGIPFQYCCLEKSHGRRSLAGCSPCGCKESDMTDRLHFPFSLSCIGEGNGNPLQCSCLKNLRDGRAQWAAVCGVAQSQKRLKRLGSSSSSKQITAVNLIDIRHT